MTRMRSGFTKDDAEKTALLRHAPSVLTGTPSNGLTFCLSLNVFVNRGNADKDHCVHAWSWQNGHAQKRQLGFEEGPFPMDLVLLGHEMLQSPTLAIQLLEHAERMVVRNKLTEDHLIFIAALTPHGAVLIGHPGYPATEELGTDLCVPIGFQPEDRSNHQRLADLHGLQSCVDGIWDHYCALHNKPPTRIVISPT